LTPASTRLEAISSLANVNVASLPLGVNAIEINEDGVPCIAEPPQPSRLRYVVHGLPFYAAVSPEGDDGVTCQVWAEVGVLPFTVQSPAKRAAILTVLQSSKSLPTAKLLVQGGQKIILFSETRKSERFTPEDIIFQTVTILQEARPFLAILAEYL
jgi:hypothetical protein